MKNALKKLSGFFTTIMTLFMGVFMNSKPVSHRERLYEKMARHNNEAYKNMRKSLRSYAQQFILPIGKYNRKTKQYEPDKNLRKYNQKMKERKEELLLARGCKRFYSGNQSVIALNQKNADRKFANMNKKLRNVA